MAQPGLGNPEQRGRCLVSCGDTKETTRTRRNRRKPDTGWSPNPGGSGERPEPPPARRAGHSGQEGLADVPGDGEQGAEIGRAHV